MRIFIFIFFSSLCTAIFSNEEVSMHILNSTQEKSQLAVKEEDGEKETIKPAKKDHFCKHKGFFIEADFLYWNVRNNSAVAGLQGNLNPIIPQILDSGRVKRVNFKWEPGARVGIGYDLSHGNWDISAFWTYIYSNVSRTLTSTNYSVAEISESNLKWANYVKGSWKIHYHFWDLEFGKCCLSGKYFSIRPHLGAVGTWIPQKFTTKIRDMEEDPDEEEILRYKNNYWGVGLKSGLNGNWFFCSHASLFGDISGALLCGRKDLDVFATYDGSFDDTRAKIKNKYFNINPLLQLIAGLSFGSFFNDESMYFNLKAGYEINYLFDQNSFHKEQKSKSLQLSGLTAKALFKF